MAKTKGLIHTLPGAPLEPHVVFCGFTPVPGYFAPHIPTPVGGPGELTVKQAQAYADDPTTHLALVDCDDPVAARVYWSQVATELRALGIAAVAQSDVAAEKIRANDELQAAEAPALNEEE